MSVFALRLPFFTAVVCVEDEQHVVVFVVRLFFVVLGCLSCVEACIQQVLHVVMCVLALCGVSELGDTLVVTVECVKAQHVVVVSVFLVCVVEEEVER